MGAFFPRRALERCGKGVFLCLLTLKVKRRRAPRSGRTPWLAWDGGEIVTARGFRSPTEI
jgi:hypothetical protein